MHYLLMLRFPEGAGPQEGTPELDDEMRRWGELNEELRAAGVVVGASGLEPRRRHDGARPRRASVDHHRRPVRRDQGDPVLLLHPRRRGPRRRPAWAAKMPSAEYGSVEIHPMIHHEFA